MIIIDQKYMLLSGYMYKNQSSKENSYSLESPIVKLEEKQLMCDICTNAIFNNFVEVCIHEITCKLHVEDNTFRKYTTPILSELVYFK